MTIQEARRNELKNFILSHARQFDMSRWLDGDNQCPNAYCIGGAADVIMGYTDWQTDIELHEFGLSDEIVNVSNWPENIRNEYVYARAAGDYDRAAAAGVAAIDYYGK